MQTITLEISDTLAAALSLAAQGEEGRTAEECAVEWLEHFRARGIREGWMQRTPGDPMDDDLQL